MAKNIIICSDGTGNEVEENLSNVLKLFRVLQRDNEQIVFYDPGMGTLGNQRPWSRIKQQAQYGFYSLTGANLDRTVLKMYKFLIDTYEEDDQIYLFGYSRGAYAVRVLAGFIHLIGLLRPEQKNLCNHAFGAYKQASEQSDFEIAWRFERVLSTKRVPIKFIGVWDTVSSVIIPRFLGLKQQTLPYTATNPSVEVFRQAISIDEKRAVFRLNKWTEPQTFQPNKFNKSTRRKQNIKQVWFAGSHGDVGGGFPETESGLAKIALAWMIGEAAELGLEVSAQTYNHLVLGRKRKGSNRVYVEPDPAAKLHDKMPWHYWIMEFLPKRLRSREWPERMSLLGLYLPLAEPRLIPDDALIHQSVIDRMEEVPEYQPVNFPKEYKVFK